MGSRTQSHQLRNGLIVSGRPENLHKDSSTTVATRAAPYTGGDIKNSGELGKMFDNISSLPTTSKPPSRPTSSSIPNSGSTRSGPNSGQLSRLSNSGSMPKKSSGQLSLQPTGLITSGPLGSSGGPVGRKWGRLDNSGQPIGGSKSKPGNGSPAVTNLGNEKLKFGVRISRGVIWVFGILVLMGLLVGGFIMVALKKVVILMAVVAVMVPVLVGFVWNYVCCKRAILEFIKKFPNDKLTGAADGQLVKISGTVTCGGVQLESSFQEVSRCVYVSTELHEYRGWSGKSANAKHRRFSWDCRHSEKYVTDFYISDMQTGSRAHVKAGHGVKVAPLVEPATIIDITKENKELSPNFLKWLADRNLSSDDRIMRLKEGYVHEGSLVTVMGIVRRHDNLTMIVPPTEPISTGCQWLRCLLPMYIEGLILHCDDVQNSKVIPV